MRFTRLLFVRCWVFALGLVAAANAQTTWYVDSGNTGQGDGTLADPFSRVDFAIGQPQVVTGDTLLVMPGYYEEEAIFLSGKKVVIEAVAGPTQTFFTGSETGSPSLLPFVSIFGGGGTGIVLRGFSFTGFLSSPGSNTPAVEIFNASPLIENCHFGGQSSQAPSALIQVLGGAPCFLDCTWGADSLDPGGLEATAADLTFTSCAWMNTSVPVALMGGSLLLEGCELTGNSGSANSLLPGTVCALQAVVTISRSTFRGSSNPPRAFQGPQHLSLDTCQTLIEHCSFEDGLHMNGPGAGVNAKQGSLTVLVSDFEGLSANRGGAVGLEGVVANFEGCHFQNNNGALEDFDGGAIYADLGGNLTVVNCDFSSNRAGAGGAIACGATALHATGSRFIDNRASRGSFFDGFFVRGGAILAHDFAQIEGCEFIGNLARSEYPTAVMDEAFGGALYLGDGATVRNCLFQDNVCDAGEVCKGGAIWANAGCDVERCVLVRNQAVQSVQASGGALGGKGVARHCTLVENSSTGSAASAESWNMSNSILVPVLGTLESVGPGSIVEYSLSPMGLVGLGNVTAQPGFRGPDDFHLLPGSAAIDSGNPASPPDPDGSRADMGVFPFERFNCGPGCIIPLGPQSCLVVPNSTGLPGRVFLTESTGGWPESHVLIADQLPQQVLGCFLLSHSTAYVPGLGGGQGTLCLGDPVLRLMPSMTNLAGQAHLMIDLANLSWPASMASGDLWSFQFWHRDRFAGLETSNMAASLTVHLPRD